MNFHVIEPEVIVGLGDNTEMDTTQHPPIVSELHIELEDWLGDDLMENFPCYIITEALAEGIRKEAFTGVEIAPMEVTLAEYFRDNYQLTKSLPEFQWLKVYGHANTDDFGVNNKLKLVISDRALHYLRANFTLQYARVDQPGDLEDLFASL